jgi:hypothetical protein
VFLVTQARVNVPDDRFKWLCDLYKPKSEVPAFLEICDIAGLVKGAAQGEGLGNAFLSHIMAVDGIFHVCRGFDDSDIVHVEDRVDPVEGRFAPYFNIPHYASSSCSNAYDAQIWRSSTRSSAPRIWRGVRTLSKP